MKYTTRALVLFMFAYSVSAPLVADAAWWNPFSWFKKQTPPVVVPNPNSNRPTTTMPTGAPPQSSRPTTTPGNATSSAASTKPLPPTAKPPVTTMPVQAKPVVKPVSTTTTGTKPQATSTSQIKVEIPRYVVNQAFTPSGFSSPRTVKIGTTLLVVEAEQGTSSQAIGNWYIDKVVWRIDAPEFRTGDMTVAISSGQKIFEDVSTINESYTSGLKGHVASDPLTFFINGRTPNKGVVKIIVEEIHGRMKNSSSTLLYSFKGMPLVGPEIRITN